MILHIEGFTKKYGNKTAVKSLNLDVNEGEIFGFIGHNGAGKTTTLRSVAGILPFDEGIIQIDGCSIKQQPIKAKQKFVFLPDNPDLYNYLTGLQFINFVCDINGIDKQLRTERIEKYAAAFELTSVLANPISSYSHGMQQKLALISAFVRKPRLLILDEPFVGLDPQSSHTLKQLMAEMCAEGGAILFSTHVLEVAEKLCDRIAIIKKGEIIKMGNTADIVGDSSLEDVFLELSSNADAVEK